MTKQTDPVSDSSRQVDAEITPAMIEAGVYELRERGLDMCRPDWLSEVAEGVYRMMELERAGFG